MNRWQKAILGVGLLIVSGMAIFPPWLLTTTTPTYQQYSPAGHWFIESPPVSQRINDSYRLDFGHLFLEVLATFSATSAAALVQPIVAGNRHSNGV